MSSYQLDSLQKSCPLVKVEEGRSGGRTGLTGRNSKGEVLIHVGGEINRKLIDKFRTEYLRAVTAGIIKPEVSS